MEHGHGSRTHKGTTSEVRHVSTRCVRRELDACLRLTALRGIAKPLQEADVVPQLVRHVLLSASFSLKPQLDERLSILREALRARERLHLASKLVHGGRGGAGRPLCRVRGILQHGFEHLVHLLPPSEVRGVVVGRPPPLIWRRWRRSGGGECSIFLPYGQPAYELFVERRIVRRGRHFVV